MPCRESGSTLRFLIPAALLTGGGVFGGTKRLPDRGVGVYENLLRDSASFERISETDLRVSGALHAGEFKVPGDVSSQFISGLLFALPVLEESSTLSVLPPFESRGYVDLTLDAMRRFGVRVRRNGLIGFFIPGGQKHFPAEETVEGDWSQAAFFCAMNALGGEIGIRGFESRESSGRPRVRRNACADSEGLSGSRSFRLPRSCAGAVCCRRGVRSWRALYRNAPP